MQTLNELIEYSKKTRKLNFALQLQSMLKDAVAEHKTSSLVKVGSLKHTLRDESKEFE